MTLEGLVASWEAHAAEIENQPVRSEAANARREKMAALLRHMAAELQAVINPHSTKSKVGRVVMPVAMHPKFLRITDEFGVSPTYAASCLCDECWMDNPTKYIINHTHVTPPIEVTYTRKRDDSKLVLEKTAPATSLTAGGPNAKEAR